MSKEKLLLSRLDKLVAKTEKLSSRFSAARLFIFLAGIFVSLYCFFFLGENFIYLPLIVFTIVFLLITHFHSGIIRKSELFKTYRKIKKEIFARKNINWDKITNYYKPETRSNLDRDLNISGNRSLLHLINMSANKKAGEVLYKKLTEKKSVREIRHNQKIVTELSHRSDIINKVLLYGYNYKSKNFDDFQEWLFGTENKKKYLSFILSGVYVINILLILLFLTGTAKPYFYYSSIIYIFCYYFYAIKTSGIAKKSDMIIEEVKSFSGVFNYLCDLKLSSSPALNEELKIFTENKSSIKSVFKNLKNITSVLELRGNPFIWFPIILIFPVDLLLISKLDNYREALKEVYPQSVEKYNKLAANISLALFKLNNPDYCTPELVEENDTLLETEGIGHPLIQKNEKVVNSYSIKQENSIDIITGSNMSGKSTFLRTIGINLILAYAGSSVNAERFMLTNLNLFTCINVSDSVVDGISYFYSEVKRLNELLKLKESLDENIFVLIDEIFKGTNNKERLEGSQLFIENIIGQNIFGLISTHDLELAKLENKYPDIRNYHFKDSVKNNNMEFEYKLLEGVCPTTNALKIIRNTMNI